MEWMFFFFFSLLLIHANEISLSLYIYRFFHILQISYEIKVYSHAYLTICFIELACYGSRDNVLEQIIWIWNWRKFRLNLRYMILTSAALNPLSCFFCFPFVFSFAVFLPPPTPSSWAVFVIFVLKLAVSWLDYFILFRLLNSLFRLYSMLHEEKQVIGVCSASVGKCFFFINLFKT